MKKVFALLLSVAMVICMMPSMAFAEEFTVQITAGTGMTADNEENLSQSVDGAAITSVVFTAATGYYFPVGYSSISDGTENGITVSRDSYTQITVSGTPTKAVTLTLAAATEKTKEDTPNAKFTATGADSGTLSDVTDGMKYSIDGGTKWVDITDTTATINSGVTVENGIQVVKKVADADANTKADSDPQTIDDITKAKAPTTVTGTACTSGDNNDGKLTGVTTDMEYQKKDDQAWTAVTGTEVTSLANGTYYVRVKAKGHALASDNQTVTIAAFGEKDKVDLTAANFTLEGADTNGKVTATYTGKAQEVTVKPVDVEPGTITKKYFKGEDEVEAANVKNAGTYTVKITTTGSETCNAIEEPLAVGTLVIEPKAITITAATATDRTYNGSKDVAVSSVTFDGLIDGETLAANTGYTATGVMADANASATPKEVEVTVTLKNGNYTLAVNTCETTVTISKAAAFTIAETNVKVKATGEAQGDLTADMSSVLKNIPEDATYEVGAVTDTNTIINGTPTFDKKTKTLTYSLTATAADTNTATIPVKITMTNYEDSTADVVVTMTAKTVPTVTADDIVVTYSGEAVEVVTESGVKATAADGSEIKPTDGSYWALKAGQTNPTNVAQSGTFTLVFTPTGEDANTYESVEKNISVTINKAETTATLEVGAVTEAGTTLGELTLTKTNSVEGTFTWELGDDTPVTQGTEYKWIFTPTSENYETVTGKVTPWKASTPSTGGGVIVTDPLPAAKTESTNAVQNYVKPADYEEAEAAEIKAIMDKAAEDIKNAKTEEEVKAIEAAAKEAIDKIDTAEEKAVIRTVEATKFRATSKRTTLNGKKAIKITWTVPEGAEFDGYDVFRSTKQFSGFGKKPFFTTTKQTYTNNKGLEVGKTYYYKVRAYKYVNGRKVYSEYSYKAIRTMK